MRKLMVAAGSMILAAGVSGQEAIQCVNPDVLNALVFNGRAEARLVVKRAMPDDADGYRAPEDFTLIGSGVRGDNAATVVAYKTTMEADKAFDALFQYMYDQGWRRETPPGNQLLQFTVAGPVQLTAQLCRSGDRRSMQVREIEGVRYATINGYPTSPPRACNAPAPGPIGFGNPMGRMTELRGAMPQISFPETSRQVSGMLPGTSVNGANTANTAIQIESPDTADSLATYIAQQLAAQNWRNDAKWNGELSTGSTWSRTADNDATYWGMLEILRVGKNVYDVEFTVSSGSR